MRTRTFNKMKASLRTQFYILYFSLSVPVPTRRTYSSPAYYPGVRDQSSCLQERLSKCFQLPMSFAFEPLYVAKNYGDVSSSRAHP